jgi:phosphoketolase
MINLFGCEEILKGEDYCGLVTPIMISNGRRIDQRTMVSQEGGINWFTGHLKHNTFDPIVFDGKRNPQSIIISEP